MRQKEILPYNKYRELLIKRALENDSFSPNKEPREKSEDHKFNKAQVKKFLINNCTQEYIIIENNLISHKHDNES